MEQQAQNTLCINVRQQELCWDSMSGQKQQIQISFSAILVFSGVDWLSWLSVEGILLSKATTTKGLTKGSS